ncbi:hypothetical protein NL676_033098 [Syzygium grande]|nr:hypothetical protein NL676_033098 [Syzygium grande]
MRPSSAASLLLLFLVVLRPQIEAGRVGGFVSEKLGDTQDSEGIHLEYPPAHASPPRHDEIDIQDYSPPHASHLAFDTQDSEGIHSDYAPAHVAPSQHN